VRGSAAKVLGALLSGSEAPNPEIRKALNPSILAALVQMTRATPVEQLGAANAIAYFVDNSGKKKRWMIDSGSIPSVVYLLGSSNKDVQQAGARAVRCLCRMQYAEWPPRSTYQRRTLEAVRDTLFQSGAVPALAALLSSTRTSLRYDSPLGEIYS
jgi:hypothetical protein